MKKANKYIALLLTIAMLLTIVPAQVFAEEPGGQQEETIFKEESTGRKSPVVTELTEERDRYTKVYLHADGTLTAFVSGEPLHYEQDGEWLDIDNTLQADSVNGRDILTNADNEYNVELPKELDSSSEIKISSGDHSISFSVNGMEGAAEAQQEALPMPMATDEEEAPAKTTIEEYAQEELENKVSKVTYPSISPNVDIEYEVHPEQLKENIILNEQPKAGTVFSFHIDAVGLNGVKNADSSVSFLSGTEEIFRVAAPFMFDSAGVYSSEIEVTLAPDENGRYTLTYAPSAAWLADAGRAYPVIIDPYITSPDGIWDYAGVQQQNPAVNYGGMAPAVGKTVSGGNTYESYAYFKTNGITVPYNGKILKSEFHIGGYKGAGSGASSVSLYEVTSAWDKGTITWNSQPAVSPVLTDYLPDSPAGAGDYFFDITKLAEKWTADPSANFGFMLKSGFTGSVNLIADAAGNTLPPVYMTIEYTDPNRALDDDGYHIQDIGRAGKAYVNNQTGSLMVKRTDLQFDGNRAPAEFTMVYNSANTGENTYGRGWNNQYDEAIQYLNNTVMGEMFWIDRGDGTRQYFDKYIPGPDDETGESGTPVMTPLGGTALTTASDGLRVRSGPGTSYSVLGTLPLNTTVRLLGWYESINWYKVQYGTGVGYVIGDYLTEFSKIPMTEIYGTAVYSDTGNLNVRMGPDTGYNLLGTISSGSAVTLLGSYSNGWYQIDYNGSAGCITGQYLTGVSTAELTAVYGTAQVSATNNLNVRSAPTTSAAVLGRLSYETEVDLLGYYQIGETKWYKIIYNDGYGYVSGDWLKNIKDGYNFIDRMSGEKVKLTSADGELIPSSSNYTLTYEDETVKEYTNKRLTKITAGNEHAATKSSISLSVSGTLINSITDGAGRVYQISRYRGRMTSASYKGTGDTALRQVSYTYSDNNLIKVTYPDGLSVNYTWTDGNLTKITDVDGYSINYEYTGGRVTKITETASDGTVGESISISYGNKSTVYTDTQGHQEIINFDNYGNQVSVRDELGNAVFSSYDKNSKRRNQLTGTSSIRRAVINYAANSGFELTDSPAPLSGSNTANTTIEWNATADADNPAYSGTHYAKISKSNSLEVTDLTASVNTESGKPYTASVWVRTVGNSPSVKIQIGSEVSEPIQTSGKWQRIQVSAVADGTVLPVKVTMAGNGYYYLDDIQLEQGVSAGSHNTLENADFTGALSHWTGTNLSAEDVAVAYAGDALGTSENMDTVRFKMTGSLTETKSLTQRVYVNESAGQEYTFGGWAYCENALPDRKDSDRKMSISVTAHKADNTTEVLGGVIFDTSQSIWQFQESSFKLPASTDYIDLSLNYTNQSGTAYFDGIQLCKEPLMLVGFDSKGSISSGFEGNVTEDSSGDSSTGEETEASLESKTEYDSFGNITRTYDELSGIKLNDSSSSYSTNGNQLLSETDAFGNTTSYTYNNDLSIVTGVTDGKNNTANYTYDNMGQLIGVSQTASNPYYADSSLSLQNVYEYSEGKLSSILSGGTVQYHFEYDKWGNVSEIKVGDTALIIYHYTSDALRNIQKLEYANGLYTEYEYDTNHNLTKVYYGNPTNKLLITEYGYDADQNLISSRDYENNTLTKYKNGVTEVWDVTSAQNPVLKYSYGVSELEKGTAFYEKSGGNKLISEYTADEDDNPVATFKSVGLSAAQETVLYQQKTEYDGFNRVSRKSVTVGSNTTATLSQTYSYTNPSAGYTTGRVSAITNTTAGGMNDVYGYNYDENGNITKIYKNSILVNQYQYDEANQLIREDNAVLDKTYTYKYDNHGNILEKRTYSYTTSITLGSPIGTVTYGYTDTNWQDKLTSYNGKSITCDANGNPLTFDGYTYTWEEGRQLAGISGNGLTTVYTYDSNGIRTSKTVNGIKTNYSLVDNRIISETAGSATIHYRYNADDELVGLFYDGQEYFYVKNLQNDIIGIVNASGVLCVTYTYDAWGNVTVSGALASSLGIDNPFRYRGYYYDKETNLYYLQGRYYNPSIGRFINADDTTYLGAGDSLVSYNLFVYCHNSPIMFIDPDGKAPWYLLPYYGAIHTLVQKIFVRWYGFIMEYPVKGGRIDLYQSGSRRTKAAAWEIKSFGTPHKSAVMQLTRYIDRLGGTKVARFGYPLKQINIKVFDIIWIKTYNYPSGIIYYSWGLTAKGYLMAATSVYSFKESLKTALGRSIYQILNPVCSGKPSYNDTPSTCFTSDTLIATNNGLVPISDINVGDLVYSQSIETGEKKYKKVLATYVNETTILINVLINGEIVQTTLEHPFYTKNSGWISASKLNNGDEVLLSSGHFAIVEEVNFEVLDNPITVYNFSVDEFHTYFVSPLEILVHNSCY